jgi:hypothetical protein
MPVTEAISGKQVRQRRALRTALAGIVLVGLAFILFDYFDVPSEQLKPMVGQVTSSMRERGGFIYCQVRLANGVFIKEPCAAFPVGTRVTVERQRRRLSGRVIYDVHP